MSKQQQSAQGATPATAASGATPSDDERLDAALEHISQSVHVKFAAKDSKKVKTYVDSIIMNKTTAEKAEWRKNMRQDLDSPGTTTGFVVGENQNDIFVLTCSHLLQVCYDKDAPISAEKVNQLFNVSIHCDHSEVNYRLNKNTASARVYTSARVAEVNSRKDLLLLTVKKGFCNDTHQPLELAQSLPCGSTGKVGMVSWPYDRHRTRCKGHMSNNEREYDDICHINRHSYDFNAIEVNISAESGSSGAPLVDLEAKLIGLLHGGRCECFTYFVSLAEVRTNLTDWGLLKSDALGSGAATASSSKRRKLSPPAHAQPK